MLGAGDSARSTALEVFFLDDLEAPWVEGAAMVEDGGGSGFVVVVVVSSLNLESGSPRW